MPESNRHTCSVCQNSIVVLIRGAVPTHHCPFCQTELGATSPRSLSEITGFRVLGVAERDGPAKIYVAETDNEKFLITLLEEGSSFYSTLERFRDRGESDPYRAIQLSRLPNLTRTYPVVWKDRVAIAVMDYLDGKTLGDWIHALGPASVADAVGIVLTCLRLFRDLGDNVRAGQIHPNSIQVCDNGDVTVTAYAGVLFTQFQSTDSRFPSRRSRDDLENNLARLTRFSSVGYQAPEYDERLSSIDEYTGEQYRIQNIFCLGALLFELLANHQIPTVSSGKHLVKGIEFATAVELRPDAPPGLSRIVQRMLMFDPVKRYQTYGEVITDLEALGIASEAVSFIKRTAPPAAPDAIETVNRRQWRPRGETFDFRRLHWGMTHDEIRKAESDNLQSVMPAAITIDTEFKGLGLRVIFSFVLNGDEPVGVCATMFPADADFVLRTKSSDRLAGSDVDDEISKLFAQLGDAPDALEELQAKMMKMHRELDVDKLLKTYEAMKELITLEYGAAETNDGPLLESPEYVDLIVQGGGQDRTEVLRYCQSTVWQTDRTYATLSISPMPMGGRQIIGRFVSLKHAHLLPN